MHDTKTIFNLQHNFAYLTKICKLHCVAKHFMEKRIYNTVKLFKAYSSKINE